jgi:hypothetical protein
MNPISPKVIGAVAGSSTSSMLAIVIVYVLSLFKVIMPTEVAMALAGLLVGFGTFVGGYLPPHGEVAPK